MPYTNKIKMMSVNGKLDIPFKILERREGYERIEAAGTTFYAPEGDFEKHVVNRTLAHFEKVQDFVRCCILPYMTRKSANFKDGHSHQIKQYCQKEINKFITNSGKHEYISTDEINYVLALFGYTGVRYDKRQFYYDNVLYYPISSDYHKQFK